MRMKDNAPVITIDGPSGTGKGTLCSRLSRWLGWNLLDSGALYRILALLGQRAGLPVTDADGVAALVRERFPEVQFTGTGADDPVAVSIDGVDVGARIRLEDCGNAASALAAHGVVRASILAWQRSFQRPPGLVTDGRDMGTVVFPDAELKIFLTANPRERAKRRYNQLSAKGIDVNLAELAEVIAERDRRDTRRRLSPLKPAADAVIVDTSGSGKDEVFARVTQIISNHSDLGLNI